MNGNACWREYLRLVLSIRWPSLRVDLFTRVDWPPQFITYTADIHHISALRDMHAIIISQQPHTTGHMIVCPLLWLPVWFIKWLTGWCCGFLYVCPYNILPPTVTIGVWFIILYVWVTGALAGCLDERLAIWSSIDLHYPHLLILLPSHLFQLFLPTWI